LTETGACGILNISFESQTDTHMKPRLDLKRRGRAISEPVLLGRRIRA